MHNNINAVIKSMPHYQGNGESMQIASAISQSDDQGIIADLFAQSIFHR